MKATVMTPEPLISVRVGDPRRTWQPGECLECEYQIDAVEASELLAVEASVLWQTEGKGDEDMAVCYFERRTAADAAEGDLRALRRFEVDLPNSPLSYDGRIVKIRWCVRIRAFFRGGKETFFELPFRLGDIPPVRSPVESKSTVKPASASSSEASGTESGPSS